MKIDSCAVVQCELDGFGSKVDCLVFNSGGVLEAELGKTALDGHLSTLETDLVFVTGASLCTLGTAGSCTTLTGTLATAYTLAVMSSTFCRFQF